MTDMLNNSNGSSPNRVDYDERLAKARGVLAHLCEIDSETMTDRVDLARSLMGVSEAILDLASAKLERSPHMQDIFEHFEHPNSRTGRRLTVQGDSAVNVSVSNVADNQWSGISHEISVPDDERLQFLLGRDPNRWRYGAHSKDYRINIADTAEPFSEYYTEGAPLKYFRVLQEVCAELLTITE